MKFFIVIFIYLSVQQVVSQTVSPCPSIFKYVIENGEWVGRMNIPAAFNEELVINVHLSIGTQLPTNYYGHIELGASNDEIVNDITAGRPIKYRVRFPQANVIPQLTGIVVNNQRICSGPPVSGGVTTNIKLEHTLTTPQGVNPIQPVSGGNTPIISSVVPNPWLEDDPELTEILNQFQLDSQPQPVQPQPTRPVQFQPIPQPVQPQPVPVPVSPTRGQTSNNNRNNLSQICGLTQSTVNPLVVRGQLTQQGDWPWLSALYKLTNTRRNFICGGSLVSDRIVVTAAHCTKDSSPSVLLVALGKYNLNERSGGSIEVQVSNIYVHPEYKNLQPKTDADIALLELANRVTFNNIIRPICLWSGLSSIRDIEDQIGTVVGWGRDETGELTTNGPRLAKAPIVSNAVCVYHQENFRFLLTDRNFCAGYRNGTAPCNGDSGGGLVMPQNGRWALRGVVSIALKDQQQQCNTYEFVVYTDVSKYLSWITQYIT